MPAASEPSDRRGDRAGAERASAERAFQRGSAHFNLGEYAEAVLAFEEAYRLQPLPLLLYNIAQSYRYLGDHAKALTFYKTYLREDPRSRYRAEVQRRIGELETASARPGTSPPSGTGQSPAADAGSVA